MAILELDSLLSQSYHRDILAAIRRINKQGIYNIRHLSDNLYYSTLLPQGPGDHFESISLIETVRIISLELARPAPPVKA